LYIVDSGNHCIRRVGPDGIITTVAGNGRAGYSGDGGLATQAQLSSPLGVALGPPGTLDIADNRNAPRRRVGACGILTTLAGTGAFGYGGDGGLARQASLTPISIAVGLDGSLYIVDYYNYRIRRIGPDGIITTLAGTGGFGYNGDGGLARQAPLSLPF